MMSIPMPESPWLSVTVDLCGPFPTGKTFLILVDYYSQFPFIEILKNTTSSTIISKLFKIFSVNGLTETLTIDNRGQLTSNEVESFLEINVITHNKLHRYGPEKIGKLSELIALLRKLYNLLLTKAGQHELDAFLWSYRNTPHCTTDATSFFLLFSRAVSSIKWTNKAQPHKISY